MTDDQSSPKSTRSFRETLASKEVIAALVVGVFTLAAAIATAVAANWIEVRQTVTAPSSQELTTDVDGLQKVLTDTKAENMRLRDQLSTLEAQSSELQAQIDNQPLPSSGEETQAKPTDVYRQTDGTPLEIASGSCVDLDSQEANWGVSDQYGYLGADGNGLCFWDGTLELRNIVEIATEPTKANCDAQTVILGDSLDQVRSGMQVCGHTGDGRVAYVRVVEVSDDKLAMDLRIWD
ncbi:hypothetical protein [Promicromonospora iranensis]|uniref:Uncharacterized protein n=1 Tax=Promicromonospora iranensis TaxID=1105144 RepID=A0ABU2CSW2_9MICO|nr:hypothetical protein [Promicromonospora iranensis]MDR7384425.1 hypothetical protein [Promicromonospora iranensis]